VVAFYVGDRKPFHEQMAQCNDCIQRLRGLARWVALFDTDEFLQPMAAAGPSASALQRVLAKYEPPAWGHGGTHAPPLGSPVAALSTR
jgi:hypothetical protein